MTNVALKIGASLDAKDSKTSLLSEPHLFNCGNRSSSAQTLPHYQEGNAASQNNVSHPALQKTTTVTHITNRDEKEQPGYDKIVTNGGSGSGLPPTIPNQLDINQIYNRNDSSPLRPRKHSIDAEGRKDQAFKTSAASENLEYYQ